MFATFVYLNTHTLLYTHTLTYIKQPFISKNSNNNIISGISNIISNDDSVIPNLLLTWLIILKIIANYASYFFLIYFSLSLCCCIRFWKQ